MGHEIVQAYEEHVLPVLEKLKAGKGGSDTHLRKLKALSLMTYKRAYMGVSISFIFKIKHMCLFYSKEGGKYQESIQWHRQQENGFQNSIKIPV